ncbi:MAG TPA: hypothetical protein PLR98_15035, partial [Chitinophagaceae bacterium]|nr:hypothetical protein [Chitinophagaceae bacterium]
VSDNLFFCKPNRKYFIKKTSIHKLTKINKNLIMTIIKKIKPDYSYLGLFVVFEKILIIKIFISGIKFAYYYNYEIGF